MSVEQMSLFFAMLALAANGATLFLVFCVLTYWMTERKWSLAGAEGVWGRVHEVVHKDGLSVALTVALVSTFGSLYFSEVANFVPCELCWFQRIGMYPLSVILVIALARKDRGVGVYVLPLAGAGALVSLYHYMVQRFPDLQSGGACNPAFPCTDTLVWEFSFISIPYMAMSGFMLIAVLLALQSAVFSSGADVQEIWTDRASREEEEAEKEAGGNVERAVDVSHDGETDEQKVGL